MAAIPMGTSIIKKQIVAVSGLALVGFILAHLAGNFNIFLGPEWLNGYAEHLEELGPVLWLMRIGLLAAAIVHITFTVLVTIENRRSRGVAYAVAGSRGGTTFAKKTMILSGLMVLSFLFLHLSDFTFADKHGPAGIVAGANGGESLGLYGIVWNAFLNPLRVVVYIFAVCCLGLHLSHGIQSCTQSLGLSDEAVLQRVTFAARAIGALVALSYASIPVYVIVRHFTVGIGV